MILSLSEGYAPFLFLSTNFYSNPGTLDALQERVSVDNRHVAYVDCSNGYRHYITRLEQLLDRIENGQKSLIISFGEDTTLEVHPLLRSRLDNSDAIMIGQNFTPRIAELMEEENSPLIGCVEYAQDAYGKRVAEIALSILNHQPVSQMNYTTHSWIPNDRSMATQKRFDRS